ncbi:glycosyltransferase family 4 protein [Actinophytocola gossypii]|uniref:glycosyltransferase family 4 protein n=1 Tax=Actinophytocola gossypii TaxID=2812003 RepID=UPI0021A26CBE|nr:glycosyltransferase family 4 protein [Actinophytocola gossypii]
MTQPVTAGVAEVVRQFAVAQRDRGWSVTVVCPPTGWLPERCRAAGVDVCAWPATRNPGPRVAGEVLRLRRILRRLDPDAVHLHSSKAGLAGRLAVRGRRPTVFQPHMWSFQVSPAAVAWERFAARWTHQLVCVSDDELEVGRAARIGTPAEVVCNGVDTERLRPADRVAARRRLGLPLDSPVAVCVGRLAPLKGQDQLLSAWPAVLAEVPDARLVLVGDGPMTEPWRAGHPVARHGSVVWWGHSDDVATHYAAADVVVLPSRAEGMALVPLEAMACGRSVVAFDVGGVRQSLAGGGAVLPAGDVPALAEALAGRLAYPVLADHEGRLGRRRAVDLFGADRAGDRVATLLEKLVTG